MIIRVATTSLLLTALVSTDPAALTAQISFAELARRQATAPGAAMSMPISNDQVVAKLSAPRGAEFVVKVQNGGMIRVLNEQAEETRGFVVKLLEGERDSAIFYEYLIEPHDSGAGEVLKSLERSFTVTLGPGNADSVTEDGYYFELVDLLPSVSAASQESVFPRVDTRKSICCRSCSGTTVCSCAISACEGSCCSGGCCGIAAEAN